MRIAIDILQLRFEPFGNMGHGGSQRSHKETHRSRGELCRSRNCEHKCCYHIHIVPKEESSFRNKVAFSRYDCEKSEKVLLIRDNDTR